MATQLSPAASNLMASLRGGAALVVAIVHAFQIFCLPYFGLYGFPHLFSSFIAAYAVILFFIVSGFMIFISIENHTNSDRVFNIAGFFRARLLRIYPPLIVGLVITLGVWSAMTVFDIHGAESFRLGGELFLSSERVQIEWERLLPTVLLIYNVTPVLPISLNGPLWTLSYEWWFYLLVMFAANAMRSKSIILGFLPLAVILVVFRYSPFANLLWVFLLIWLGGFLLGYLYSRDFLFHPRFWAFAFTIPVGCVCGMFLVGGARTISYLVEPLQRYGSRAHFIMMFVAFILTVFLGYLIRKKYNPKVLLPAAEYSYTLYVVHFPLLLLAFGLLHKYLHTSGWFLSFVAGLGVTAIITRIAAWLARFVENRALIKRLWQGKLNENFCNR